jgi:hypothetical protein
MGQDLEIGHGRFLTLLLNQIACAVDGYLMMSADQCVLRAHVDVERSQATVLLAPVRRKAAGPELQEPRRQAGDEGQTMDTVKLKKWVS